MKNPCIEFNPSTTDEESYMHSMYRNYMETINYLLKENQELRTKVTELENKLYKPKTNPWKDQ